jgi:hypothetical protein
MKDQVPENSMLENEYNRYFLVKMVVYLINVPEGENHENYVSLSGTIISSNNDDFFIRMPYPIGLNSMAASAGHITYKLTSEVMGVGVQVLADLVNVKINVVQLRLRGNVEIFQRRQCARVDTTVGIYQFLRDVSLESYRTMCRRLSINIENSGVPSKITLKETAINLSASGLRLSIPLAICKAPPRLSLFLLDLGEGTPPICTVAELIWTREQALEQFAGYRFIQINIKDRDLISRYVRSIAPLEEVHDEHKKNWELLDRMFSEDKISSKDS